MFKFSSLGIVILCCLYSCSEIGEYYSADKGGEIESIQLRTSKKILCDFVANSIQSDFNAMLYVKLIDTTTSNLTIKNYLY